MVDLIGYSLLQKKTGAGFQLQVPALNHCNIPNRDLSAPTSRASAVAGGGWVERPG
jgi:hypothetical protein